MQLLMMMMATVVVMVRNADGGDNGGHGGAYYHHPVVMVQIWPCFASVMTSVCEQCSLSTVDWMRALMCQAPVYQSCTHTHTGLSRYGNSISGQSRHRIGTNVPDLVSVATTAGTNRFMLSFSLAFSAQRRSCLHW